jgi:hypothetical protein
MAILYRPVIEKNEFGHKIQKYNWEEIEKRSEYFKEHMTCDVVFSSLSFSLAFVQAYTEVLKDCLDQGLLDKTKLLKLNEGMMKMRQHFNSVGGGIR